MSVKALGFHRRASAGMREQIDFSVGHDSINIEEDGLDAFGARFGHEGI
jgi:hypothetical protein